MADYDVLFLALARDCAKTLPGALDGLRRIQQFGLSGVRVHMLVGENGSKDGTRELLDAAAETGSVTVVDTSFMAGVGGRLERMARGRQHLADLAADISTDVVAVVDLDEPFLDLLDRQVFVDSVSRLKAGNRFAIAANSHPTYYDLLAFEDERRSFTGLERQISERQRNPVEYYRYFRDVIYPAQRELTTWDEIDCVSAFNGLCLYPADIYALGSYLPDDGNWICEHVTFNRGIAAKTGQRMVVDGRIVLFTPPEHGHRGLPGFVFQRVKKLPGKVAALRR